MSRTDTCCWWKGNTETLSCFCLEYSTRECRILFSVWVGLMWFPFRLSVPETQLCEQWSGEAWTKPPMAISVERRQPNKQRNAWCVQVTAQPAVKKHLTLETIKAITCSRKPKLLITGHCLTVLHRLSLKWCSHSFQQAQNGGSWLRYFGSTTNTI